MPVGGVTNFMLMRDVNTQVWRVPLNALIAKAVSLPHDSDRNIAIEKIELFYVGVGGDTGGVTNTLSIHRITGTTIVTANMLVGTVAAGLITGEALTDVVADTGVGTIAAVTLQTNFTVITGEGGARSIGPVLPATHKLIVNHVVGAVSGSWEADLQIYWRYLDNSNE